MSEKMQETTAARILVGGGIGSGKSAVVRRMEALGARVIVADEVGHDVLDSEAFESVAERWPQVVVGSHIDRATLAKIVFANADELSALESMTHRAIAARIMAVSRDETRPLVVEIPVMLILPGRWVKVLVDADEDSRVNRAVERGSDEGDVRRRMKNQALRDEWLSWADVVIENNGSIEDLHRRVDDLWLGFRTRNRGGKR